MFANNLTAPAGATMQNGRLAIPQSGTNPNRANGMVNRGGQNIRPPQSNGPAWTRPTGVPQPTPTAPTGFTGTTFNQPGIGTYTTGITAGQLPQASIDSAMGRLNPSPNLSAGAPYGTPVNRSQQGELNTLLEDQLRQGTWENKGELARDSAFQQAQMQLAYDRARGQAALGGYTNLYNQQADKVNNDQARQSMLLNLLNSIGGLGF